MFSHCDKRGIQKKSNETRAPCQALRHNYNLVNVINHIKEAPILVDHGVS